MALLVFDDLLLRFKISFGFLFYSYFFFYTFNIYIFKGRMVVIKIVLSLDLYDEISISHFF